MSIMFTPAQPLILILVVYLLAHPVAIIATRKHLISRISVGGVVYCDICSSNSFSKHSYFLPGVDVHIECKFRANSPRTTEDIIISVNRTTNRKGEYRLEIPSVDGINCADKLTVESFCQASLIHSSSPTCKVPGLRTSTSGLSVKSREKGLCIYNFHALTYRPSRKNTTLCRNQEEFSKSFESSKFFLPYGSPRNQLPFPFSFQSPPPSLPFPFPNIPRFPPIPSYFSPPPPAFNLRDPRTWIPIPKFPSLSPPPPPPAFNLGDPRTWIPHLPPPFPRSP